jgi:hypothetical protein
MGQTALGQPVRRDEPELTSRSYAAGGPVRVLGAGRALENERLTALFDLLAERTTELLATRGPAADAGAKARRNSTFPPRWPDRLRPIDSPWVGATTPRQKGPDGPTLNTTRVVS